MSKTAKLTIRIGEDVKSKLATIAKHEDRTPSYIVEQAIKDRIAYEEATVRAIENGLREAKCGEVVPHEAVKAWVKSWGRDDELPVPKPNTTP